MRRRVASPDIDDINDEVRKLAAEVGREVVPARLNHEEVRRKGRGQVLQLREVDADVLADGGVRAAAGLHCADALRRQRVVTRQKLAILLGEDVVGDLRASET